MADEQGSVETGNPEASEAPAAVAAAPAEGHFLDSVADADLKGWAEHKQFPGVSEAMNSYRNLEKMMGADKAGRTVTLLGDDATPDQRNEFYGKLGRPDAADGYTFKLDDGADTSRLDAMRSKAHELGISDTQFSGLAQADLDHLGSIAQSQSDETAQSATDADAALRKEWGAAYENKVAGINAAAEKLGFTDAQLVGLNQSMGPVEAMKFVDTLNSKIGDHDYDSGETVMPNHKTPEQARLELSELTMSKDFMDAWLDKQHPGHKAAVDKKTSLSRLVTGIV